jgi:hypothetical protein
LISVLLFTTSPVGRMPVALSITSPPVMPAMLAGFHHRLSAPVSATSPE